MTVTRNPVNGSYEISGFCLGRLVTQTYYGFTRREAISEFRFHLSQLKAEVVKEKRT